MAVSRVTLPLLFASVTIALGQAPELPVKNGPENLEVEAKQLMEDLPVLRDENSPEEESAPSATAELTVEQAKGALERARLKQARWESLARKGVLSRAEAEGCVVEVAEALARHERARVKQLRADLAALKERQAKGEASADLVTSAENALQTATELSASADQQARRARIANARTNVERYRKLFAARLISRNQMQRAESALQKAEADGQEPLAEK